MGENQLKSWRPGTRDMVFLGIVGIVVLALVLGSSERTTKATPNDEIHRQATSRAACMTCHDAQGAHPQPSGHTKADQCFQCHTQPEGW
ncbi:MAG: hypothetical protein ACE5F3_07195 [Mariprofundaceae bacterium]